MKFKNKKVSSNDISNFSYEFMKQGEVSFLSNPLTPHIQRFQVGLMNVITSGKDQENVVLNNLGLSHLLSQMYSAMFPNVELHHHEFYQTSDPDGISGHEKIRYGNDSIITSTSIISNPSRDSDNRRYQTTTLWIGPLVMKNLFKAAQLNQRDFANLIIPTLLGNILKMTYTRTTTDISLEKDVRSLDAAILLKRLHEELVLYKLNARRELRYVTQKAPAYAKMLFGEASISRSLGDKDEPFIFSYKDILFNRSYEIRVLNADRVPYLGQMSYFYEMNYFVENILDRINIPYRDREYISMSLGDRDDYLRTYSLGISSFGLSNDYISFSHSRINSRNNVDPVDYYLRDIEWVESIDWESKIEDSDQRKREVKKYLGYLGYDHIIDPEQ